MKKAFRFTVSESIPLIAALWILSFLLLWALGVNNAPLALNINIFELAFGFFAGGLLLVFSARAKERLPRAALIGTAFAVFSWTLGQVFWLSYSSIAGTEIPYPSVGDLGYTGTYFFLIGVIGLLARSQPGARRGWYGFVSFLPLAVPVIVLFAGSYSLAGHLYNFFLTLSLCFAFFESFRLLKMRPYRLFVCGVFLLGIADTVFMLCVCLLPESRLYASDLLYVAALALVAYGMLKGAESHD